MVNMLGHIPVLAVRGRCCCLCQPHRFDPVLGQAAAESALYGLYAYYDQASLTFGISCPCIATLGFKAGLAILPLRGVWD